MKEAAQQEQQDFLAAGEADAACWPLPACHATCCDAGMHMHGWCSCRIARCACTWHGPRPLQLTLSAWLDGSMLASYHAPFLPAGPKEIPTVAL